MPSSIPPPDSNYITLGQFLQMKQAYANAKNAILQPPFQGDEFLCISELFNIDAINNLAAVDGCAGMRIYYGMDPEMKVHAMMVAVGQNGRDILPDAQAPTFAAAVGSKPPPIVEEGQRCPPSCPP